MNATIETHWSRILYSDIFAAGAEMPHPSEIGEGDRRRPGGGRHPATRRATAASTQRGGSRANRPGKER